MLAYHRPNPDDAGPIVRRPMGLPITASCDTAWNQTRVSVVTRLAPRCSALDRCATQDPQHLCQTVCERVSHASCACLHTPPGVTHLLHYPLCIYTCVLCLSVASFFCFVKPSSVFPSVPVSRLFLCSRVLTFSACPDPDPACRPIPLPQLSGLLTPACP